MVVLGLSVRLAWYSYVISTVTDACAVVCKYADERVMSTERLVWWETTEVWQVRGMSMWAVHVVQVLCLGQLTC